MFSMYIDRVGRQKREKNNNKGKNKYISKDWE